MFDELKEDIHKFWKEDCENTDEKFSMSYNIRITPDFSMQILKDRSACSNFFKFLKTEDTSPGYYIRQKYQS